MPLHVSEGQPTFLPKIHTHQNKSKKRARQSSDNEPAWISSGLIGQAAISKPFLVPKSGENDGYCARTRYSQRICIVTEVPQGARDLTRPFGQTNYSVEGEGRHPCHGLMTVALKYVHSLMWYLLSVTWDKTAFALLSQTQKVQGN